MAKVRGKISEEIIRDICRHIAAGQPNSAAAGLAGINKTTLYRWIARAEGRHDKRPTRLHKIFLNEFRRACARRTEFLVGVIRNSILPDDDGRLKPTKRRVVHKRPLDGGRIEETIIDEWDLIAQAKMAAWMLSKVSRADFGDTAALTEEEAERQKVLVEFVSAIRKPKGLPVGKDEKKSQKK